MKKKNLENFTLLKIWFFIAIVLVDRIKLNIKRTKLTKCWFQNWLISILPDF